MAAEVENTHQVEDFLNTGRTGRRNAMADVMDSKQTTVSTADLPFELDKLSCCGMCYDLSHNLVLSKLFDVILFKRSQL